MDHDCHDNEVTHSEGVTCLVCSQSNNDFIHISDPQDDVEYNEKVCELAEKMGFEGYIADITLCYSKMREHNKNHSLNILLLSAIFYMINQVHYLAVENLLPYSECHTDECILFQRIQDIIIRSKLKFPSPAISTVVQFACDWLCIKPKYWDRIIQSANSISEQYLKHGKCQPHISNLVTSALFIFNPDLGRTAECDPCRVLHVPRPAYKRTLGQIRRWANETI